MAGKTGCTYISESMTDIIKIPTANQTFSITASWKRVSLGDSNNDRQPEMAAETGNTYISETMTDSVEILTVNLGFMTMQSSKKVSTSNCSSDRQPEIAIWPPKTGNNYIAGTMTDSVEIPRTNSGFSTKTSSIKV